MLNFVTKAPLARRTLFFGSATHIWSDLFFALFVPLLPLIKEDMGLSFTEVGLLRSIFSGASAVLQIPAGFLAEVWGEFWLLIWGNIWVSVGLIGMALSPVFVVLIIVAFIAGLGGGTQHPLASSMVSRAYDVKGRSTAVGTVNFAGDLGKMIAPIVALIAIPLGWRAALWIVGIAGLIFMTLSILTRRAVDIGKPVLRTRTEAIDAEDKSKMGGFVTLSFVGFLDSATRTAALVFLPFVMHDKGLNTGQISALLILLFAGGAVGKFVVGWLGDRMGTITLIWWTKGLTAALLVIALVTPPIALIPLLFVTGIGLNGTSSILYATVSDFVPSSRRGRFYGFYYTTNEGGTVLAPLAYGVIADIFSLNTTMIAMGIGTAVILPASLALRKFLSAKTTVIAEGA